MMLKGFVRKHRNRKKRRIGNLFSIGTICLVLIGAFGLLGASYASWNQSFTLFGSIHTGEVSVIVRDVVFESSDPYESMALEKGMEGSTLEQVNMDIATDTDPFRMVLVFIVENNGTIPVECEGIDSSVKSNLEVQVVDSPGRIEVGESASIKVEFTKGYCEDFEFSAFIKFVQATS